jgi:hypothetical protein
VRLAKGIAGWLQEDAAIRQLRRVAEPILSRFEFFVDVGFQPGVGEAEFKVPELQAGLHVNIRDAVKRIGIGKSHADDERN